MFDQGLRGREGPLRVPDSEFNTIDFLVHIHYSGCYTIRFGRQQHMKKGLMIAVLVLVSLLAASPPVFADSIQEGDTIKLTQIPGLTWSGGPFQVNKKNGDGTYSYQFITFCVSTSQYFTPGTPYTVTKITDTNPYDSKKLQWQTACLYSHFLAGDLASLVKAAGYSGDLSFALNANNLNSFKELQRAIWFLQGQGFSQYGTCDALCQALIAFANSEVDSGRWNGLGDIRMMILAGSAQPQLVQVPEPNMVLLLGVGLVGIVAVRRRMK
jgi:hypothetical protein